MGDDDLLEILGQAANPEVIQAHLKKLYVGIHSVTLTDGSITHMHSIAREKVPLVAGIKVSAVVESWLNQLTEGMKASLAGALTDALGSEVSNKWTTQPAQILSLTAELRFCMVRSVALHYHSLAMPIVALQYRTELQIRTVQSVRQSCNALVELNLEALAPFLW